MKTRLNERPWQDLLPKTFGWLDGQAQIGETQTTIPNALHVVVGKKKDKGFELLTTGLGENLEKALKERLEARRWKGASTQTLDLEEGIFAVIGLSSLDVSASQKTRQLGLDAAEVAKSVGAEHIVFAKAGDLHIVQLVEGFAQGMYSVENFQGDAEEAKLPAAVTFVGERPAEEQWQHLTGMINATSLTRLTQDAPANWLDPIRLAEIAEDIAKDLGGSCKVLDQKAIEKENMGSLLSVSKGSDIEPRVIVYEVKGKDPSKTVALVGKGVTFDTGGISIKPAKGMEEMKYDMSGAAAVLGAMAFLSKVQPPTNVVGVIGAVENMPSGKATKPGDVVQARNGKTIEVLNTDAEGRLVLADVLHYAQENYKPIATLNIATLTGAVLFGLGTVGAAVMSNSNAFADFVKSSANEAGEPLWQLPLWAELAGETKGKVADLKNMGGGSAYAGTIMAGMFLKEFVNESPWAHLDIAGTGWNAMATGYPRKDSSAFGVRSLIQACLKIAEFKAK